MNLDKKLWLCDQYAQKTWIVSLNMAQEAARAGQHGRGYAVAAEEARTLANKLFAYYAQMKFEDGERNEGLCDFAIMMKFLSINTMLEAAHSVKASMEFNIPKSMAVLADDLQTIAAGLTEISGINQKRKPFTIPEPAFLRDPVEFGEFILFSFEGQFFIENMLNIKEICYPSKADVSGEIFSLRGHTLPILDFGKRFGLSYQSFDPDRQTVLIIDPEFKNQHGHSGKEYALLIDDPDINIAFFSRLGRTVPPDENNAFAKYARECWDAVGGGQLMFLDWKKIISE